MPIGTEPLRSTSEPQFSGNLDGVKNSISFEVVRTFVAKKFGEIGRQISVIRRRGFRDVTEFALFGDCGENKQRIALLFRYS